MLYFPQKADTLNTRFLVENTQSFFLYSILLREREKGALAKSLLVNLNNHCNFFYNNLSNLLVASGINIKAFNLA